MDTPLCGALMMVQCITHLFKILLMCPVSVDCAKHTVHIHIYVLKISLHHRIKGTTQNISALILRTYSKPAK